METIDQINEDYRRYSDRDIADCEYEKFVRIAHSTKGLQPSYYEGLPHQKFERELLEAEMSREDIIHIGGYPFYDYLITPKLYGEIESILLNTKNFLPHRGPGLCGGFHPDVNFVIVSDESKYHFQVCVGCGEMRVIEEGKMLAVSMSGGKSTLLKSLLKNLRIRRPKEESGVANHAIELMEAHSADS